MQAEAEKIAKRIVSLGSQITFPYDAGDAYVTFMRRDLVKLITEALLEDHSDAGT